MEEESTPEVFGLNMSAFTGRICIALQEKGIPFKFTIGQLSGTSKSERVLELNPVYKQFPVLIHNGKPVCESLVILEYIEDTWSPQQGYKSLFPLTAYDRYISRFWTDFIQKKIFSQIHPMVYNESMSKEDMENSFMLLEKAYVDNAKGDGPFFFGSELTFVDVALAPLASWMQAFQRFEGVEVPSETKNPGLHAWISALAEHPNVKPHIGSSTEITELVRYLRDMYSRLQ